MTLNPHKAWEELRSTRSTPLSAAPRDTQRKLTYTTALEQAQQLFRAAETAGTASMPLSLFYGLSQAGRAIAAASPKLDRGHWRLSRHGIKTKKLSVSLPDVQVFCEENGSYVTLAEVLDSPTWSHKSPIKLGDLWDTIPETAGRPIKEQTDSARRTPLRVTSINPYIARGPLIQALVSFQQPFPDISNRENFDEFMRSYPRSTYKEKKLEPPPHQVLQFVEPTEGFGELELHWEHPKEREATLEQRQQLLENVTQPYLGERWLFPAVGSNSKPIHPFLSWWAVLFSLSMLARYEPAAWAKHISVDQASGFAVPIERLLRKATETLPAVILETLHEVKTG